MLQWGLSILSTAKLLAAVGWQITKMLARFSLAVTRDTVLIGTGPKRKKRRVVARYLVECGAWKLRVITHGSGRSRSLSSLSLTMRTDATGSTSTATTPREPELPLVDVLSSHDRLGRQFESWASDASS